MLKIIRRVPNEVVSFKSKDDEFAGEFPDDENKIDDLMADYLPYLGDKVYRIEKSKKDTEAWDDAFVEDLIGTQDFRTEIGSLTLSIQFSSITRFTDETVKLPKNIIQGTERSIGILIINTTTGEILSDYIFVGEEVKKELIKTEEVRELDPIVEFKDWDK